MYSQSNKMKLKNKTLTNETKLLFLDFDGVLNSYEEGSYKTHSSEEYGPSITICNKIIKLCKETGAKIIISSNWRKFNPDGWYIFDGIKYKNPLAKVYELLGEYIIDTLPPEKHVTKAIALILWFEETNYRGDRWVILDDDYREELGSTTDYNINKHYIETNPEFGITDKNIEQIEKIIK